VILESNNIILIRTWANS